MAKFSKQHYEAIGGVLSRCRGYFGEADMEFLVNMFIGEFEVDNTGFKEEKFRKLVYQPYWKILEEVK